MGSMNAMCLRWLDGTVYSNLTITPDNRSEAICPDGKYIY